MIQFLKRLLQMNNESVPSKIIGKKIIIISKKGAVHRQGICFSVDRNWALSKNNKDHTFYAKLDNLFWSENQQAYLEVI